MDSARIGSGVASRLSVRTRLYQSDIRTVGASTGGIVTHQPSAPDVMRGQVLPLLGSDAADTFVPNPQAPYLLSEHEVVRLLAGTPTPRVTINIRLALNVWWRNERKRGPV